MTMAKEQRNNVWLSNFPLFWGVLVEADPGKNFLYPHCERDRELNWLRKANSFTRITKEEFNINQKNCAEIPYDELDSI